MEEEIPLLIETRELLPRGCNAPGRVRCPAGGRVTTSHVHLVCIEVCADGAKENHLYGDP